MVVGDGGGRGGLARGRAVVFVQECYRKFTLQAVSRSMEKPREFRQGATPIPGRDMSRGHSLNSEEQREGRVQVTRRHRN